MSKAVKTKTVEAGKSNEVILVAPSLPEDKQERTFSRKEAAKLLNYEKARGKQLWFIKDGQNIKFEDGRISDTDSAETQDAE